MRLGMREAAKYKRRKSRLPLVLACLQGSGTTRVARHSCRMPRSAAARKYMAVATDQGMTHSNDRMLAAVAARVVLRRALLRKVPFGTRPMSLQAFLKDIVAGKDAGREAKKDDAPEPEEASACGEVDDEDDDIVQMIDPATGEWGGPTRGGTMPEPTRFGDWERKGRCTDF